MELVKIEKLLEEIANTRKRLEEIRELLKTCNQWDVFEKLARDEFECSMILSGAFDDLQDYINLIGNSEENKFLINRIKKEAEKCRPMRLEL